VDPQIDKEALAFFIEESNGIEGVSGHRRDDHASKIQGRSVRSEARPQTRQGTGDQNLPSFDWAVVPNGQEIKTKEQRMSQAAIEAGKSALKIDAKKRGIVENIGDHADRLCTVAGQFEGVIHELAAKLDQFDKLPTDEQPAPKAERPCSPNDMLTYGNSKLSELLGQLEEQVRRL